MIEKALSADGREKIVTLDVREEIRLGHEPFSKIMTAVAALGPDQDLLLIAPFEPAPLFSVLARKGFQHTSRQMGPAHWEVLFNRGAQPPAAAPAARPAREGERPASSAPAEVVDLDARGLEPPQPMVRILETLATLSENAELAARTDRRPVHLYAHLQERGFAADSEEQADGSFITHIRRR